MPVEKCAASAVNRQAPRVERVWSGNLPRPGCLLLQPLNSVVQSAENHNREYGNREPADIPFFVADLQVLIVPNLICEAIEHNVLLGAQPELDNFSPPNLK